MTAIAPCIIAEPRSIRKAIVNSSNTTNQNQKHFTFLSSLKPCQIPAFLQDATHYIPIPTQTFIFGISLKYGWFNASSALILFFGSNSSS